MRRHPVLVLVAALTLGAGTLAACAGGSSDEGPTGAPGYVAIGDSYVSGPGIAPPDTTQPGCLRSLSNYPHLVAADTPDVALADVSCGGETTEMLRDGRTLTDGTVVQPQLGSIGRSTRRVTVGIGANDSAATSGLYQYCLLPASADDAQCRTFVTQYMPTVFPRTRKAVASILDEVTRRAPEARVQLTGYLRLAPDVGSCDALPIGEVRRALVASYEKSMRATLVKAAQQADVPFVDLYAASQGHDACAVEPWVNGVDDHSATGDGAFLHPTAAGMRAAADAVRGSTG